MLRLIACTAGCAVAASLMGTPLAAPAHPAADGVVTDGDCTVIRHLPNGQRIVTPAPARRGYGPQRSASAGASSSSSGGASVSVSSSSQGGGRGSAVASSSSGGRTVTTTHDGDGCTIVIDDRGRRGERP